MIGLSRLKRAIADAPTGGMQTGTSKVQLKLCDAQRIEVEYGALIAERDNALAQNAELVAQVEALRNLFPLKSPVSCEGFLNYPLRKYNEVVDAFNSAPQQHLCDIQAEAGRAGFVAGYSKGWNDFDGTHGFRRESLADQYAERVKAGEV